VLFKALLFHRHTYIYDTCEKQLRHIPSLPSLNRQPLCVQHPSSAPSFSPLAKPPPKNTSTTTATSCLARVRRQHLSNPDDTPWSNGRTGVFSNPPTIANCCCCCMRMFVKCEAHVAIRRIVTGAAGVRNIHRKTF
jgi:hypothetical protein